MRRFLALLPLALLPFVISAQQPTTPPQMPPGTVPIGPDPRARDQSREMERTKKNKKGKPKAELPTITAEGVTVQNDGKSVVFHTADGRWITMTIDDQTKYTQAGADITVAKIVPRTTIKAEMAEDEEANLTALTVDLEKDASATPPASSDAAAPPTPATPSAPAQHDDDAELADASKPLDVPDAPDRPKLHRAKPKQTAQDSSDDASSKKAADPNAEQDFTIGESKPVRPASAGGPGSDVLERSSAWLETFNRGLPNYICRQVTTRYAQQSKGEDWQPQDVVTADIVYQDGHEDYRNVMVGNKKVSNMMKTGGSWSTGEFASMLLSLFHPARDTEFKYYRTSEIHDTQAAIFDFKVALPNSDWSIILGGQTLLPSYRGSIWVEKSTGVVRRMEQEAVNIPKDFPMDEVQTEVEYDEISLGVAKFLLPVHAENIACQRATSICTKNVIDFRDYHKFAGESTINFK